MTRLPAASTKTDHACYTHWSCKLDDEEVSIDIVLQWSDRGVTVQKAPELGVNPDRQKLAKLSAVFRL